MNTKTAHILCDINTAFYQQNAASFSATRHAPWEGWNTCAEILKGADWLWPVRFQNAETKTSLSGQTTFPVLDLACGNLRFEKFLTDTFPQTSFSFYAVDNCEELTGTKLSLENVHFQNINILKELLQNNHAKQSGILSPIPLSALSVSFGFMHHVPTQNLRQRVLELLVNHTLPSGYIICSFWQFLNSATLAQKARKTHQEALAYFAQCNTGVDTTQNGLLNLDAGQLQSEQLEPGDYFLGWSNTAHQYRYCHSFSDAEIKELLCSLHNVVQVIGQFSADGRTHNLNTYVVLQKTDG